MKRWSYGFDNYDTTYDMQHQLKLFAKNNPWQFMWFLLTRARFKERLKSPILFNFSKVGANLRIMRIICSSCPDNIHDNLLTRYQWTFSSAYLLDFELSKARYSRTFFNTFFGINLQFINDFLNLQNYKKILIHLSEDF